jgi:hypothetical protein
MPDTMSDGHATTVELPAVYSQGGFVQVRTIVLKSAPESVVPLASANDQHDESAHRPAS